MAYQKTNLGQADNGSLTATERIESAGEQLDKAYELAANGESLGKDLRGFLRKIGDSFGLSDKGVNWPKRGVYARVKTPSTLCKKPNWTCALPVFSLDVNEKLGVVTDNGESWAYVINANNFMGYVKIEDLNYTDEPLPASKALPTNSTEARQILKSGIDAIGNGGGALIPIVIAALSIGVLFGGRK